MHCDVLKIQDAVAIIVKKLSCSMTELFRRKKRHRVDASCGFCRLRASLYNQGASSLLALSS